MNVLLSLILITFLTSCSSVKKLSIFKEEVAREKLNLNTPTPLELENLRWISESANGYQTLFPDVKIDIKKYINCGVQIFDKEHEPFLKKLKDFYFDRFDDVMKLQNEIVKKGTDQPVYNYFVQKEGVKLGFNLPPAYHLTHLSRFDWFSHNWQLNEDKTPFFIKYGYLWKYSGFDRKQRTPLMKQTWDLIKENYE